MLRPMIGNDYWDKVKSTYKLVSALDLEGSNIYTFLNPESSDPETVIKSAKVVISKLSNERWNNGSKFYNTDCSGHAAVIYRILKNQGFQPRIFQGIVILPSHNEKYRKEVEEFIARKKKLVKGSFPRPLPVIGGFHVWVTLGDTIYEVYPGYGPETRSYPHLSTDELTEAVRFRR